MEDKYPFKLIPLPYEYNALEPYIDEETMMFHHDKHLANYVNKLNSILEQYPDYHNMSIEEILRNIFSFPEYIQEDIRNNAGGVFNHNMYFNILGKYKNTIPNGNFLKAIIENYGSIDEFLNAFKEMALSVFGSGYTWLVIDETNNLKIVNTPNQNTVIEENLYPILLIDVWEHAYYLKNQNRRDEYIDNFFKVIDWNKVEDIYNNYLKDK